MPGLSPGALCIGRWPDAAPHPTLLRVLVLMNAKAFSLPWTADRRVANSIPRRFPGGPPFRGFGGKGGVFLRPTRSGPRLNLPKTPVQLYHCTVHVFVL